MMMMMMLRSNVRPFATVIPDMRQRMCFRNI